MTIKTFFKSLFIEEKAPNPVSKIVNAWNYNGDQPDVSFKQLMDYHDRTPQISVGVAGYAKLIDLANIQINSDNEQAKKIIEDWNEQANIKDKLESLVNTLLICGNAILEKLDDKNIQDVVEVDMSTITDKKRDDYGNTLYYYQSVNGQRVTLGETNLNKFIEFNLTGYSRKSWSPCLFHSLVLPRIVRNRTMMPLVEVLWGMEDAMSAIILNNAYPITYVTFEGANEDELTKEAEKLRKRKPGDTHIVTKKPQLDMYETQPQSKYTDYINHIEKVIQLGIKFPSDILTGDFTSRASSDTTEDLTLKIARGFQRYIGNKLKTELYDPILAQNGIDPKEANISVSFSTQNIIQLTPIDVLDMVEKKKISTNEFREWLGDNTGIDLFDDDMINNDVEQQKEDEIKTQFNQPKEDTMIKKELESIRQLVTPKRIDPEITKRADQIKEKFYAETIERTVKESLRDILDEVKDVIEDKKFNRKVKSEILDKLNKLTGDKNGS